jgi:hypothetical protein
MSRKTNATSQASQGYQHAGHGPVLTRRDMLARGMLGFSGYVITPSVLTMMTRAARAEELVCAQQTAAGMVPFLVFDLVGGGNIAGTNVIPGDVGGQMSFLKAGSYSTLGLSPDKEPGKLAPNTDLGLAFHPDSKMLAGIKQFAPATTTAKVNGALFCTTSNDDQRTNPHNPLYWIAKAGRGGSLVSLVGTNTGTSGGNAPSPAASINPAIQPSRVTRPADAAGLVDPGKLASLLTAAGGNGSNDLKKILDAVKTMSESRLAQFQQQDVPTQIQDLIRCGYVNSSSFLTSFTPDKVTPTSDTAVTSLFNVNGGSEGAVGTIAKLLLDDFVGAAVCELGGYDYHGQGRGQQDAQDLLAGQMIGKVLQLAALKQKPIMIYVVTDGGVSSNGGGEVNGIYAFANDSGERSAAFALLYDPAAETRPKMLKNQIGAFQQSGAVDTTANKISTSVENLTRAVVANYLAVHGRQGDLSDVIGATNNPFSSTELDDYIAFDRAIKA